MKDQTDQVEIDGFLFSDPAEIAQAKKEMEGIRYLRTKLDRDNPEQVLLVYNQAVDQQLFATPVGYYFLKELQDYLITIPFIKDEDIHRITITERMTEAFEKSRKKTVQEKKKQAVRQYEDERKLREKKIQAKNTDFKARFALALFFDFLLLAMVVAMFVINLVSKDNVTILNYENQLINKYEDWEKELEEREMQLNERERAVYGENENSDRG
ncbi:MAG: hypothetical protein IJJ13_03070 [Lachnospiraceae bacterium]|nr:hypothetical protein [Lachnospiraceae bacterium]